MMFINLHTLVGARTPTTVDWALGHLKKKSEVLIFGAALGFSHYVVHLMPISSILSKIDQYLDLMPHRLSRFCVLVHALTLAGTGDYMHWGGPVRTTF